MMAQLQQLGEMKAQGLLSDEEFAAMKSKLVGADRWFVSLISRRLHLGPMPSACSSPPSS